MIMAMIVMITMMVMAMITMQLCLKYWYIQILKHVHTICNVIFQYLHFLIIPTFDEVELQISEQIDIHLLLFTFCFPHLQHCTPVKVAVQKRSHGKSKTNDFTFKLKVVVQQQPRGSYTLEVFKGFLAVGGQLEMMIKIIMTMTMLTMMTMLIMVKLFR